MCRLCGEIAAVITLNRFEELEEDEDMADEEEDHRDALKSAGGGNVEEEEQLLILGPLRSSKGNCHTQGVRPQKKSEDSRCGTKFEISRGRIGSQLEL